MKNQRWEIDYIPCELKECLELLKSNDLELMTSLGKSPMHSEVFTFSEEPIWTFWGTIYAHNFDITSIFDLRDKKIGVRSRSKITRALQRLLTNFPIILCTGFSETIDEEKAMAIGIQGYILKPVLKNQLTAVVRKVFGNG